MSAAYDLQQLSPVSFEHLVNALALRVLGAGHTGFGPGKDGGRDGYFRGEAFYPNEADRWSGVWFVQSKFLDWTPGVNQHEWLTEQLRRELAEFGKHNTKRRWPDILILATNIDPSGAPQTGCFDRLHEMVSRARPQLKFDVWGGHKILTLLREQPLTARQYGHLLTAGHVLSELYDKLQDDRASSDLVLRHLVAQSIDEHRSTKLDQAGWSDDRKPGVHDLFTDLPFRCTDSQNKTTKGMLLNAVTRATSESYRSRERLSQHAHEAWYQHPQRARLFFIKAGPGQGKSTITQ